MAGLRSCCTRAHGRVYERFVERPGPRFGRRYERSLSEEHIQSGVVIIIIITRVNSTGSHKGRHSNNNKQHRRCVCVCRRRLLIFHLRGRTCVMRSRADGIIWSVKNRRRYLCDDNKRRRRRKYAPHNNGSLPVEKRTGGTRTV